MSGMVGHQKVLSLLRSSLEKNALSHAYLLVGPPHVGKKAVAVWLAQALNCGAAGRPCGECVHCQKIVAGKHSDVQVVAIAGAGTQDPQTEISIDQIREVQHIASLPPFEGRHKVFIIEGAEQMSSEAQNCLLKTLEEPADRVMFVLLTSAQSRLLPTVISRCQRLEMLPVSRIEVEAALSARGIEAARAALLARLCHGCFGWALRATQDGSLLEQRQQEVASIIDVIRGGYEERFGYAARLATLFGKSRESAQDTLALWLDWWHDLLLIKTGCAGSITNIDRQSSLVEMSGACRLDQVRAFINTIRSAAVHLRQNANPRLVLEVLMLGIPEMQNG